MAFPPDLTQKPRFSQVVLEKVKISFLKFQALQLGCTRRVLPAFLAFQIRKFRGMSKLMPRLGGHIRPIPNGDGENEA
jgi:hypothetical protein